jgi:hypothetical protein
MMARTWTETDIAALLDGELDGAEHDRIAHILETDPEAQACAARLRETDALLREAFAAPMDEPTPDRMQAALDDHGRVVRLATFRASARQWVMPSALAASIALLIGFAAGSLLNPFQPSQDNFTASLAVGPAAPTVSRVLDTTMSGTLQDGVRPTASFRVASGGICREFETANVPDGPAGAFGIACTTGNAWQVIMAASIATPAGTDGADFAPASGAAIDAASPVLDALGAGAAMTPDEEREALAGKWR